MNIYAHLQISLLLSCGCNVTWSYNPLLQQLPGTLHMHNNHRGLLSLRLMNLFFSELFDLLLPWLSDFSHTVSGVALLMKYSGL